MSHAALTAKYRPQSFAQVAGQDTLKRILSRASLEGKVAPAYLFSGTRGVGKTTLARIFAKALNCRNAPAEEPCNQCDQCLAVTRGNAVDVVEIDGASNRGIDDVRRLKEVVGYAPMEGGYKIFIIDEAHMLSREAFNALLKTLEEPPARVTFILATTEPHKFPATIVSRCQHYVFKALTENAIVEHLLSVLDLEGVACDESAVRLIARRASGSVRDAMSLLGQVLALGEGTVSGESTRSVLGLAGQEAFMRLLEAFRSGDTLALSTLLRAMLDQGLDMGFFLRELSSLWRNMFLLRQSGEAALSVVDLPENEARACLASSREFSLQHIHACWQMTLEGQRRVLTSLEPALALELLLLNLAMLPRLLSLESLSATARKGPGAPASSGSSGPAAPAASGRSRHSAPADTPPPPAAAPREEGRDDAKAPRRRQGPAPEERGTTSPPAPISAPAPIQEEPQDKENQLPDAWAEAWANEPEAACAPVPPEAAFEPISAPESVPEPISAPEPASVLPDWETILPLAEERETPAWLLSLLRRVRASWQSNASHLSLSLTAHDAFSAGRLADPQARELLDPLLEAWCGTAPDLTIIAPPSRRKSREELHEELLQTPLVQAMQARFNARIVDFGQIL